MKEEDPLHPGSVAPNFMLPDQDGVNHALSSYRGSWVFLCFYPKDSIAGCAREICVLGNHFEDFKKFGITILGISADSVENHKQFTEENNLPFALLSDTDKKVAEQYQAILKEQFPGNPEEIAQISFLVNIAGEVEKIYRHIRPERHASEVLADFKKMQTDDQGPIEL